MSDRLCPILIVEDDVEMAEQLADSLKTLGYGVDVAGDLAGGQSKARTVQYGVIIIDRLLPDGDGIEIIRNLREERRNTPVLIVSALGEVDDRVRGLRAGGDDYLIKPFAFAELLARIEALARRSESVIKETMLRVGDLELDLLTRRARRGRRDIALLPREFRLLEFMVRNEGHIVTRAMLLQHVWDLHFDPMTNIIDVYVSRIRRKVDFGDDRPLFHTIRGVGFCIRAAG
ncbi:MAG TPA: response regulator transcription factor [Methylocystis sp.]|jgi:two-component system OmpR family response regulator